MKPTKCIVVGTDFSEVAERALDHAVGLAQELGARIVLVHAYHVPEYSLPDAVVTASAETAKSIADAGLVGLKRAVELRKHASVPIRSTLRVGMAWEELNAVAREEDADMIVVGTHGRTGFSRLLLGSVAERILRTATLPVLVVRGEHG